jgi:T-complex protein 1 subunit theta
MVINVSTCNAQAVSSSYQSEHDLPLFVQHLDRLFVTNDAATILRELEVVHPAAKVLVMASQQQEAEVSILLILVLYEATSNHIFLH